MATSQSNANGVEYRDIPGFPGYQVGDDGSAWVYHATNWRKRVRRGNWYLLTNAPAEHGYAIVNIKVNGRYSTQYVHKLVLLAFVGPCPEGMECCHGDGNRMNPALRNVRWGTKSSNAQDKVRHGTDNRGEKNRFCKLTKEQAILVLRHPRGKGRTALAKQLGVKPRSINSIWRGESWAWLEGCDASVASVPVD